RLRRIHIRKIGTHRSGRWNIRAIIDKLNIQTFGFFVREIRQHHVIIHLQRLDAFTMQLFNISVGKKFLWHDYDFRKTPSPSTSSESIIDMITASTGVSLVMFVCRADEPAAVNTRSPMPASTVSTATYGFPETLPCSSA